MVKCNIVIICKIKVQDPDTDTQAIFILVRSKTMFNINPVSHIRNKVAM